jgi:hypothetical protein
LNTKDPFNPTIRDFESGLFGRMECNTTYREESCGEPLSFFSS